MQFLATVGRPVERVLVSPGMVRIHSDEGLDVYGSEGTKVTVWNDLIIVGVSFPASRTSASKHHQTTFHRLVDERWGTYVALRRTDIGGGLEVFADPSGMMPCYYYPAPGRVTLGSDAAAVLRAAGHPIEIDWDEVGLQLLRRDWRTTRNSIKGLCEVPAGATVRLGASGATIGPIWSPSRYLQDRKLASFEEGATSIRSAIDRCTAALSSDGNLALIGLSGGLDSSIVAASMAKAEAPAAYFTMFFDGGDADERQYARMVASHLGGKLWERPYLIEDVDIEASSVSQLPRPVGWAFQQSIDKASREIMAATGATKVARGTGGDAVFCYNNSAAPILDAFLDKGVLEAWHTTLDLCRLTGSTIFQSARAASRLLGSGRRPRIRVDRSFMSGSWLEHPDLTVRHSWLEDCRGGPPGWQRQVDMLCSPHNLIETRLALGTDVICPLLSQPVMETALGIPSWQWMKGGVNRSLARRAFSDALPAAILQRSTKGGPTSFAAAVYKHNRNRIREMLLDGRLMNFGILDRMSIELATRGSSADAPKELARLMALADAEAWTAHWTRLAAA